MNYLCQAAPLGCASAGEFGGFGSAMVAGPKGEGAVPAAPTALQEGQELGKWRVRVVGVKAELLPGLPGCREGEGEQLSSCRGNGKGCLCSVGLKQLESKRTKQGNLPILRGPLAKSRNRG